MDKRIVIALIVGFFAVVAGLFLAANWFSSTDDLDTLNQNNTTNTASSSDETIQKYPNIKRITAKHFFDDAKHTLVGEIPMPTPCDLLETNTMVAESYPEQVTLLFSVINEAETCEEKITPQRFIIEVTAAAEASFSAEFMGREVELNLLDPAPGETPDDFELYIKG